MSFGGSFVRGAWLLGAALALGCGDTGDSAASGSSTSRGGGDGDSMSASGAGGKSASDAASGTGAGDSGVGGAGGMGAGGGGTGGAGTGGLGTGGLGTGGLGTGGLGTGGALVGGAGVGGAGTGGLGTGGLETGGAGVGGAGTGGLGTGGLGAGGSPGGGIGGSTGGAGGSPSQICVPQSIMPCYTGDPATLNVGACKPGVMVCADDGSGYGPCMGEVLPSSEICATPTDDDCDGMTNEEGPDCVCAPGSMAPCYNGPAGTDGVGICKSGVMTCNALGTGYGACVGEVTPGTETCNTPVDDDCDGMVNENGAGCICAPGSSASCYSGPAGTQGIGVCKAGMKTCNALGTGYGACIGEVLPGMETCQAPADEDCDGQTNEGCAALTCSLYQENFDDGNAGTVSAGVYKLDWCDTYIPIASNTPLCMSGRTLRTNDSTIDPTIWVYKGDASCTQVKLTYSYYQFALAGVTLQYSQSNDVSQVCEKSGVFTSLQSHPTLQACMQQTVTIPFGNAKGVYIRFEHGAGSNAIWLDDLSVQLLGCDC